MKSLVTVKLFSFLMLAVILSPFYLFLLNFSDTTFDENRIKGKRPELASLISLFTYLNQFETFYSDNFPFRSKLIFSLSYIKYFLLKISPSEEVFRGEDDMLFYLTRKGVDSIGDYRGINYFSNTQLEQIEKNIRIRKTLLKALNIDFYVIVVPNKESMYPENISIALKKYKDRSRLDQVTKHLAANHDIPFLSLKEILLSKKKENSNLYYKYDSHWNNLGAFWGYQNIIGFLSSNRNLSILKMEDFDIVTEKKSGPGDLLRLIGLQDYSFNENFIAMKPKFKFRIKSIQGKVEAANTEYNTSNENKPNAYFYCDSFLMYGPKELIAESFNHSYFIWNGLAHDSEKINFSKIDIYVFEIAERYIDRLLIPIQDKNKPWIF